jgi:hypothetical protein
MCLLHHNICQPARDVHIVPNIPTNLLIGTAKFAEAGYITIFDAKEVNVYDASNMEVIAIRQAILRGWLDKDANLYCIPLITTPPPPVRRHHQIAASGRDPYGPKKKI